MTLRCLLCILAITLTGGSAPAAILYVDDDNCPGPGTGTLVDPFCSIQDAIDAAVTGNEVAIFDGTYNERITVSGKSITIRPFDLPHEVIIDGTGLGWGTLVTYNSGAAGSIENLMIRNGSVGLAGFPGGMLVTGSYPRIAGCRFESNVGQDGGALLVAGFSSVMIESCTFVGNTAVVGGAVAVEGNGNATLTGCTFDNNWAEISPGTPTEGGAIFAEGLYVRLTDCDITNSDGDLGGAIYHSHGELTVTRGSMSLNHAAYGGAIHTHGGSTVNLVDVRLSGNGADIDGGALHLDNSALVDLEGCTFELNDTPGAGGAVYLAQATIQSLIGCTFNANTALEGGALYTEGAGSLPSIKDCTFESNHVTGIGGAMRLRDTSTDISRCAFTSNVSDYRAGGVSADGGSVSFANCVFTDNSAAELGGGFWAWGGSHTIEHSTLVRNSAGAGGGGIAIQRGLAAESLALSNSILWSNTAPLGPQMVLRDTGGSGVSVALAYSDVQGGLTNIFVAPNSIVKPGDGNLAQYPEFASMAADDFRLSSGSPCIDAGDNTAVPVDVEFDRHMLPRFVDDPDTPDTGNTDASRPMTDMGAFEFQLALPGDYDEDGDVDLADHASLTACLFGPDQTLTPAPPITEQACLDAFDADGDADVDLSDAARFAESLTAQ